MFAAWYQLGMLAEAGWPRKSGFLIKRETVSAFVADVIAKGLCDSGMAVGVFDESLACSLVHEVFSERHAWDEEFHEFLRERHVSGRESLVNEFGSGQLPSTVMVPADLLRSDVYQSLIAFDLVAAVWHGVTSRAAALELLNETASRNRNTSPAMIAAGLEVDVDALPASAEDYYSNIKPIVGLYEEQRRSLPDAPEGLLMLARSPRTDGP